MAATAEKIDFTVMYATHDAFRRDLDRLTVAVAAGKAGTREVRIGWANFKHQLHIHHTVEDNDLWPKVQRKVAGQAEPLELLDEMEAEHGQLDPVLASVDDAMTRRSPDLAEKVKELSAVLGGHMKHEEEAALPLIQEVLTVEEWKSFASAMGKAQGLKGAAVYFPWIIDSIPAADRQQFLGGFPPPVRILTRLLWEPRYQKRRMWRF